MITLLVVAGIAILIAIGYMNHVVENNKLEKARLKVELNDRIRRCSEVNETFPGQLMFPALKLLLTRLELNATQRLLLLQKSSAALKAQVAELNGLIAKGESIPVNNPPNPVLTEAKAKDVRFLLETLAAVREVWPQHLPLTARFGVIEYDGDDERTLNESIALAKALRQGGLDLLSVSIGFSTPQADIPWAPAFLAPLAERVRREADMPVASSWMLDNPHDAERVIASGQMDLVMIGRAHLANPHWPLQAARALNVERPTWVLPAPYAHWLERYRSA